MICPYCSTDMEPIELNGKVFCSNCGLTIANNGPGTASTEPDAVSAVTTNAPDEVEFPVIPEVAEVAQPEETLVPPVIPVESEEPAAPRKLEVATEAEESVPQPETWSPIKKEAENDMGIIQETPVTTEPVPEAPVFESKIADLSIPSEEDFDTQAPEIGTATGSFVELPSIGNEKSNLEASGILLDILGDSGSEPQKPVSSLSETKPARTDVRSGGDPEILLAAQNDKPLDPVAEPEIPVETETKTEDDIYTLPSEVKVGLRNKKVKKTEITQDDEKIDRRTEKKIEKLEEKIATAPEPVVDITPEEATKYDPDTINVHDIDPNDKKSKIIKDYFSDAIDRDKKTHKAKMNKKNSKKKATKVLLYIILIILIILILAVLAYTVYIYFQPSTIAQNFYKLTGLV